VGFIWTMAIRKVRILDTIDLDDAQTDDVLTRPTLGAPRRAVSQQGRREKRPRRYIPSFA
jgi:hypothetical protein